MPREQSAGAIIFRREGKKLFFLLLHYPSLNSKTKKGHWEFAKGHIEEKENELKTVKREVEEETGIKDLRFIPGFKESIKYFFKRKDPKTQKEIWVFKRVIFFLAETKTKEIKLSGEHIDFLWLPFKEAYQKITYKNSKELFKKAYEFLLQREGIKNCS